ncbi:MAG: acetyl-CoA hydrolase [Pseudomonadota bacterium]|nr:acetyl-CoA hydrolase [Pseudomonadota bacterium]
MNRVASGDAGRVLAELRPGLRVYVQGATGEPLALRGILGDAPEALAGVELIAGLLPGINDFDYAALRPNAHLTTFLLPPALRASFEAGRVQVRASPYSAIAAAFVEDAPLDLAVMQVSAPDAQGMCSFGPCADFAPLVWPRARRRMAFVNANLPRARRGPTIPLAAIEVAIEADGAFITGPELQPTPEQLVIAKHIATLVPNGAAIQSGIGGAPAAAVAMLSARRNLVVRSGMVTGGYRALAEAGALADGARHITGFAVGSEAFMRWTAETFEFADATVTHGAASLAGVERFHAINSALEVDLFGQANVEWLGGRRVSGLGGALDFARAARRSPGGRGILALPSTAACGAISRIVSRLNGAAISIPCEETDLIVTEHGVADLRGAGPDARAAALIDIAAPAHRDSLAREWDVTRRRM